MALTVQSIIDNFNTYVGDTSTDRITAAERLQYVTESCVWLQEELGNETQNATYTLDYLDSLFDYKVTTAVADLLEGADLRRDTFDQRQTFAHKSAKEIAEEIGQGSTESAWSIERRDSNTFLKVNHVSKNSSKAISGFDTINDGGGEWTLDTTNGDGTNLTIDSNEFKEGNASLNFDADVSQSGNNKIEVVNTTATTSDLGQDEDLSTFLFWAYIPDVTNFTGFTLYWGSDTSNYWSATVTTDVDGSAWVDGWNRVKIAWSDATKTSAPDVTVINYYQFDYNYGGGQGDDTDFRLDDFRLIRPEKLTFHYISWNVGTDTSGTDITVFGATTDIPYFSGQYDQYKYVVAHKAASIAFTNLRLRDKSQEEESEALKALQRARRWIPSSRTPEVKNFKVLGVNFGARK